MQTSDHNLGQVFLESTNEGARVLVRVKGQGAQTPRTVGFFATPLEGLQFAREFAASLSFSLVNSLGEMTPDLAAPDIERTA